MGVRRFFSSENIFPGSGEYNTNVVKNIMAALNRAIHLKHRNTLWTTVNQQNSTSKPRLPDDKSGIPANKEKLREVCNKWGVKNKHLFWKYVFSESIQNYSRSLRTHFLKLIVALIMQFIASLLVYLFVFLFVHLYVHLFVCLSMRMKSGEEVKWESEPRC